MGSIQAPHGRRSNVGSRRSVEEEGDGVWLVDLNDPEWVVFE